MSASLTSVSSLDENVAGETASYTLTATELAHTLSVSSEESDAVLTWNNV